MFLVWPFASVMAAAAAAEHDKNNTDVKTTTTKTVDPRQPKRARVSVLPRLGRRKGCCPGVGLLGESS